MADLVTKDSFELFQYYVALKRHFTSEEYDYFKYGGNPHVTVSSLERRNDKGFFYSLAKKQKNPKGFVFANLLNNPHVWIGDMVNDKEKSETVFTGWERRMQSLTYSFKEEIGQLNFEFDQNFICPRGGQAPLFKLYLRKKISLETLTILDMILSFVPHWDRQMKDDPIWSDTSRKIKKYKPFLEIDLPKYRGILKDKFV
jgi:hypothetical protein